MTIATPLLGLPKGEGSDNERDYLKGAIGGGGLWHALEVLDNAVMLSGAQVISGKTFTGATLNSPVINTPTGDIVTPAGVATLTNKTLGSPTAFTGAVVGNVGVGLAPSAWAGSSAVNAGTGVLYGDPASTSSGVRSNSYYDGTNNRAVLTGAGVDVSLASGQLAVYTAPSVAAGAVQTMTARLTVTAAGLVTAGLAFAGPGTVAAAGPVRLANGAFVSWRNGANTEDLGIGIDSSNRLYFQGTTQATTAGGATPASTSLFLTVVVNGGAYKIPLYP